MNEKWTPVKDFEDCYSISSAGRLMRTATYGGIPRQKLVASKLSNGYVVYKLCRNGKLTYKTAHSMVCYAFVRPYERPLQVNHKNGQRGDNRLENLEICTAQQNARHKFDVLGYKSKGRGGKGEENAASKLTNEKVREIRILCSQGLRQVDIGAKFGVSQRMVSLISRREKWNHVA